MLRSRSPVLKRQLFLNDPAYGELGGADLPRALRILKASSNYDVNLIWRNALRLGELRVLNTNAALLRILPDTSVSQTRRRGIGRVAVCAHVYYVEMLGEILGYLGNIRGEYDLIVTTDTADKKEKIEAACQDLSGVGKVIVRVVEQNRGRDMAALFITCKDLFLGDTYGLVCRLHTKKTPQVESARSNILKRHMFENLLSSGGYVENVLDLFDEKPALGLAVPPIVQISFPTLGHVWYSNRERAERVASELRLNVRFDEDTPVAPYGTMFWFRPAALRKLFAYQWDWDEFNEEPNHVDGGLAHALERLVAYVAQDAGYFTFHIASAHIAEQNYVMLEWKLRALMASLPNGTINDSCSLISERARRLAATEARLAEFEARLADTEARLANSEARVADTGVRLADTGARLADTGARLAEAEARREETELRLRNTLASHSWRATAFLRQISRVIYWRP